MPRIESDLPRVGQAKSCGFWVYQTGVLVVDPEPYNEIGGAPAAFLERGQAVAYSEYLQSNVAGLNAGRPPTEASNSVGVYEIRMMRAQVLPTHFPEQRPRYE